MTPMPQFYPTNTPSPLTFRTKKSYDKPRQYTKKQRHYFANKGPYSQSESESEVAQSQCPTLCDPMDCSLPGSSVYGIFQARVDRKSVV